MVNKRETLNHHVIRGNQGSVRSVRAGDVRTDGSPFLETEGIALIMQGYVSARQM
jgi:hypothetical protein